MTMVAGVATMTAAAAAASLATSQQALPSLGSLELFGVLVVGGIVAWRSKRGDFYKSVAEEKTAESERLRADNERLRHATDITPIIDTLNGVTAALNRHAHLTEQVLAKVADMNGSLRAHGEAMKALADHLILDEAARGLLQTAARRPGKPPEGAS